MKCQQSIPKQKNYRPFSLLTTKFLFSKVCTEWGASKWTQQMEMKIDVNKSLKHRMRWSKIQNYTWRHIGVAILIPKSGTQGSSHQKPQGNMGF